MRTAVAILFALACSPALSHDADRPDLDEWFSALTNRGGARCCAMNEGNSVADADWESSNGHYRVRIAGEWIEVPDWAVIDAPNLDGRTMVWIIYSNGFPTVRCFMPGSMT